MSEKDNQQKKDGEIIDFPAQQKRREKLAIVGWSSSSRDQAPFQDQSFEIWGVNGLGRIMAGRWDVEFNLHLRSEMKKEEIDFLRQLPIPVFTWFPEPDLPNSVPFPVVEIMEAFCKVKNPNVTLDEIRAAYQARNLVAVAQLAKNRYERVYFTSSIAWQFAFGIMQGFKEIHLYGIDMAIDEEYQYQRPCLEYLTGLAEGKGIKVYIPQQSYLMSAAWLYGVDPSPGANYTLTREMVQEHIATLSQQHNQALTNAHMLQGALMAWQDMQHRMTMDVRNKPGKVADGLLI